MLTGDGSSLFLAEIERVGFEALNHLVKIPGVRAHCGLVFGYVWEFVNVNNVGFREVEGTVK